VKKVLNIVSFGVGILSAFYATAEPVYDYSPDFFDSTWQTDCTSVVEEKTSELVPDQSQIKQFSFLPTYGEDDEDTPVHGYEGWVSFNNCSGNLVIMMNKECRVKQVFTLNDCKIEGVKSY
jgi:hypothetical protein